ncbi:MAG: heme biosynthesis HemY N-terminal domain-containing protein [Sulfuricellaceae bacterium]|nr:heme biosynthesis HemY N-terminal domain-containing protein [Sulfuricellaceae bacterium]
MKPLFEILAALVLAVALVMAARFSEGYALLVYPPWRVELSLPLLAVLVLLAFVVMHVSIQLVSHAIALPRRVRMFKSERRQQSGRRAMLDGALAFAAARFEEAEKFSASALDAGEEPELNALIAARSADALGALARRDVYLGRVGKAVQDYPEAGFGKYMEPSQGGNVGANLLVPCGYSPKAVNTHGHKNRPYKC